MSRVPYNQIFRQQQSKLVPSSVKYATISSVNVAARTVSLFFAENPQTTLKNIKLSGNVNAATVLIGQRAKVDILNETRSNNMVVAYTF